MSLEEIFSNYKEAAEAFRCKEDEIRELRRRKIELEGALRWLLQSLDGHVDAHTHAKKVLNNDKSE